MVTTPIEGVTTRPAPTPPIRPSASTPGAPAEPDADIQPATPVEQVLHLQHAMLEAHLPPDTRVAMARLAFWQMCAQAAASALKVEMGHRSGLTAEEMERLIEPALPLTLADLLARAVHEAGAAEVELREAMAGSVVTGHRDNLAASQVARRRELERTTDAELDEIIHDLKAEEASEVNNAGKEAQIAYVLEAES